MHLAGLGSRVRRIHPVARFVKKHSMKMLFISYPLLTITIMSLSYLWPSTLWTLVYAALLPLPPFTMFFFCSVVFRSIGSPTALIAASITNEN